MRRPRKLAVAFIPAGVLLLLFGATPGRAQDGAAARSNRSAKTPAARGSASASSLLPGPRGWAPPDVDDTIPAIAPQATCALAEVAERAGARVRELVANLERFTATERVEYSELGRGGNWRRPLTRSFKYLVFISELRPGVLSVEETRNGSGSADVFPSRVANLGLVALALIFHPYYTADFDMACEGLGQWRGQPAWQVYFRQRGDRPARIHGFRVGGALYPVKLKGRAWISADTYQVVQLALDLLEPIPKLRLHTEHMEIAYRPVQFAQRNLQLWLPESAEQYMDYRGRRYHHRHSFRDFLLFSVDSTQQINEPPPP